MKTQTIKGHLSLAPIYGILMVVYVLVFVPPPQDTILNMLHMLLGALVALCKEPYSYYFGSSEPPENGQGKGD